MKLLTKTYNLKNEQKTALKLANKQVNKVEKLIKKYKNKFKRAVNSKKQVIYSAVIVGLELELTQALKDQKTITNYYKRMLGGV